MSSSNNLVRAVGAADFDAALAEDSRPVIVDFTAAWCGPCQQLAPRLEQFAQTEANRARVISVDVDENPEISQRFSIKAMPTLLVFHRGLPVLEWSGPSTLEPLSKILDRLANDPNVPARSLRPAPSASARTIRIPGPVPGQAALVVTWSDSNEPGGNVLQLSGGAETQLLVSKNNSGTLPELAPDDLDALTLIDGRLDPLGVANLRRMTGLAELELINIDISSEAMLELAAACTNLQSLTIEPSSPEVLERLRLALPHTRINGIWGPPDLCVLIQASGSPQDDQGGTPRDDANIIVATLRARRHNVDSVTAYLTLCIEDGYYVNAPHTGAKHAVAISVPEESTWQTTNITYPDTSDGHLKGTVLLAIDLVGTGTDIDMRVRALVCSQEDCLPPTELSVRCNVPIGR